MMVIMVRVASLFRTTSILIGIWSAGTPAFGQSSEPGQAPPPAVIVEQIEVQEVDDPSEFIARVEAIESVDIRARVEGFLHTVGFEAGAIVSVGDLLFEIEPDQYAARVASARAQLSRAEAERHAAERTLARTRELLEREVAAEASFDEAQAAFDVAHADVEAARAALRNAELDLSYTRIRAPESGRVTRRAVEAGAYVQVGQALLAIVPAHVWVVANFKETQLTFMRPGQPVEVEVDAYPRRVFKGRVDSIQAGTGSRFSLLPPENATGNFIKVVQRVPVKIIFDEAPDSHYLLAPGMSVVPVVRIR